MSLRRGELHVHFRHCSLLSTLFPMPLRGHANVNLLAHNEAVQNLRQIGFNRTVYVKI
jgi:hypothetical protein